jgi:hypothetical protein
LKILHGLYILSKILYGDKNMRKTHDNKNNK